jgi:hypothetical protein
VTYDYQEGKQEACHRYCKIIANNFRYISLTGVRHGKKSHFFDAGMAKNCRIKSSHGMQDTHRKVAIYRSSVVSSRAFLQ